MRPSNRPRTLRADPIDPPEPWRTRAWHADLWASLLKEIPSRIDGYRRAELGAIESRLAELRRYYPDVLDRHDPEYESLKDRAAGVVSLECVLAPPSVPHRVSCAMATIRREVSPFPNRSEIRVDFALNVDGELCLDPVNVPRGGPSLPVHTTGIALRQGPAQTARWLVDAAIALVAPRRLGPGRPW